MKRLVVLMAVLCGCGSGLADFQAQVAAARGCDHTVDRCVLAGASKCLCATPVNAKQQASIDEAAKSVACGSDQLRCAPMLNARCAANDVCVADTQ